MTSEVSLRPVIPGDLDLFEREFTTEEGAGPFQWFGFTSTHRLRARFAEDGLLGRTVACSPSPWRAPPWAASSGSPPPGDAPARRRSARRSTGPAATCRITSSAKAPERRARP